jgi:hypothetical protein
MSEAPHLFELIYLFPSQALSCAGYTGISQPAGTPRVAIIVSVIFILTSSK